MLSVGDQLMKPGRSVYPKIKGGKQVLSNQVFKIVLGVDLVNFHPATTKSAAVVKSHLKLTFCRLF